MRTIQTYADYKKERQTRDLIKKCAWRGLIAVLGVVGVFAVGYVTGQQKATACDDALSACEIEQESAYKRGFNDCLAQF